MTTTTRKTRTSSRYTPEQRKAQAEALHAQLTEQIKDLTNSATWLSFLRASAAFHSYSLNNLMLILAQRPDATAVAGFRQWQARGRQVRRGERGIKIRGFSTKKVTVEDEATGEETELALHRFPILTVFDISQTDPIEGTDADDSDGITQLLAGSDDAGLYELGAQWLTARNIPLVRTPLSGNRIGVTRKNPTTGAIIDVVIRPDVDDAQAAKTILHECAHIALGHLDRSHSDYLEHRGVCETEAESVAYVLAGMAGVDTSAYSVGYIASWTEGDLDTMRTTAQNVLSAVHTLADAFWPTPTTDDAADAA